MPAESSPEFYFNILAYSPEVVTGVPGSTLTEDGPTRTFGHSNPMRAKMWEYKGVGTRRFCKGRRWVRAICMIGIQELPAIVSQDEHFINKPFVNKFEYSYQPLAYDCLELMMYYRSRHNISIKIS